MTTEERVSSLEGTRDAMTESIREMRADLRSMNNRFFWLFGYLTIIWITMIGTIVAALFKT